MLPPNRFTWFGWKHAWPHTLPCHLQGPYPKGRAATKHKRNTSAVQVWPKVHPAYLHWSCTKWILDQFKFMKKHRSPAQRASHNVQAWRVCTCMVLAALSQAALSLITPKDAIALADLAEREDTPGQILSKIITRPFQLAQLAWPHDSVPQKSPSGARARREADGAEHGTSQLGSQPSYTSKPPKPIPGNILERLRSIQANNKPAICELHTI